MSHNGYLETAVSILDNEAGGDLPGHQAAMAAAYPVPDSWKIDGGARANLDARLPALTAALDARFSDPGGAEFGIDWYARTSAHSERPGWKSRVAAVAGAVADHFAAGGTQWDLDPQAVLATADRALTGGVSAAYGSPSVGRTVQAAGGTTDDLVAALTRQATAGVVAELAARGVTATAAPAPVAVAAPTGELTEAEYQALFGTLSGDAA